MLSRCLSEWKGKGSMVIYKKIKTFQVEQIKELFLSVNWDSGKYPEKIVNGLKNSSVVISAWDGEKPVGLIRGLDDGETVGFIHYLLVNPEYQGQHIGRELMNRLMDEYKNLLYIKTCLPIQRQLVFIKKSALRYLIIILLWKSNVYN